MLTRRDCLTYTAAGCASAALLLGLARAQAGNVITRTIPGTSETLPIIGLGSSATFSELSSSGDIEPLRQVFQTMVDAGGSVFDTAPSYGRGSAEEVAGQIADELGITDRIFWATKVNVARGRGAGAGAPAAEAPPPKETTLGEMQPQTRDQKQVQNQAAI
jgi:aryl-alcohol dehydrogenase-like predicted oxidoreductase